MKENVKLLGRDVIDDPKKYINAAFLTTMPLLLSGVAIYETITNKNPYIGVKGFGMTIPALIFDYKSNIEPENSVYHMIKKAIFE